MFRRRRLASAGKRIFRRATSPHRLALRDKLFGEVRTAAGADALDPRTEAPHWGFHLQFRLGDWREFVRPMTPAR